MTQSKLIKRLRDEIVQLRCDVINASRLIRLTGPPPWYEQACTTISPRFVDVPLTQIFILEKSPYAIRKRKNEGE